MNCTTFGKLLPLLPILILAGWLFSSTLLRNYGLDKAGKIAAVYGVPAAQFKDYFLNYNSGEFPTTPEQIRDWVREYKKCEDTTELRKFASQVWCKYPSSLTSGLRGF
jgi:hypothetical protein